MLISATPLAGSFLLLIPFRKLVLQGTERARLWPAQIGECYDIQRGIFDVRCSVEPQFGITKNGFCCHVDVRCTVHLDIDRFRKNSKEAEALEDLMLRMGSPTRKQGQQVSHDFMAGSLARGLQGRIVEILREWEYLREPDQSRVRPFSPHEKLIKHIREVAERYFPDQGMVLFTFLGVDVRPQEPTARELATNPQLKDAWEELNRAEREVIKGQRRTKKETDLEIDEVDTDEDIRSRSVQIEESRHLQRLEIEEVKEKLNVDHEKRMLEFARQRRDIQRDRRKIELENELDSKRTEQQRVFEEERIRQEAALAKLDREIVLHTKQSQAEQARRALLQARKENQTIESDVSADAIKKDAEAQAERLRAFVAGQKNSSNFYLTNFLILSRSCRRTPSPVPLNSTFSKLAERE